MKLNSRFDAQLDELHAEMLSMNALCRNCLEAIDTALRAGMPASVQDVPQLSLEIDRYERDIESLCLKILLQRHPVASDLRKVSSALKMITDLQRIGHQSSDVADILLTEPKLPKAHLAELAELADNVIAMLDTVLSAYVKGDVARARLAMSSDNDIDAAFAGLRERLAAEIRDRATADADQLLNILMLGKYLERMGDHVVILARWVIFSVTGERTFPMAEDICEGFDFEETTLDDREGK